MTSQTVQISNKVGLHARPASMLVTAAGRYDSEIIIKNGSRSAVAKSMISLLALQAKMNDIVTIQADGKDEKKAVAELTQLIQSKFGED
ncbi:MULTISPECIES: HPr family phosphocarrier protein [Eubacteriales]|uniref:HPr family phosphocarrier protein n=1 Tax=Eubacteriales TaxID=186802 RepID=UPI00114DE4C4|nr:MULTISPECIES: HPr family phosphocarrier protein [Eubacteriales]MDF1495653.1 HPr family phosphocarrier protein [Caproiciproducens sp. CPB-2]TQI68100.1 phosphocarrier protein [Clostridium sp. KNHs216]